MMNLLLDTCALIWLGMGGGGLGTAARHRIESAPVLYYSSISAWELARLAKDGKIEIGVDPDRFLSDLAEQYGLVSIPVTDAVAIAASKLPDFHKDPADRIIIATALLRNQTIVTGDGKFAQYGARTIC